MSWSNRVQYHNSSIKMRKFISEDISRVLSTIHVPAHSMHTAETSSDFQRQMEIFVWSILIVCSIKIGMLEIPF